MNRRLTAPGAPAVVRQLALGLVVAAAYVAAGKLGIALTVAHGVITPVWAPSGIAVAGLLLGGRRLWPAVAIGAFAVNATSDVNILVAAGIAVGNTLEAVAAVTLLRRLGFRQGFARVRDVIVFVAAAALASTTIAASVGVATLGLDGRIVSYSSAWLLWWFGDAIGALLVAPAILLAARWRTYVPSAQRAL